MTNDPINLIWFERDTVQVTNNPPVTLIWVGGVLWNGPAILFCGQIFHCSVERTVHVFFLLQSGTRHNMQERKSSA